MKDRFGDNGIVGVLITRTEDDVCEIDTFLLSCRVIGRTIETAMLGFLTDASKARGASILQGWFIPTKKNAPVKDLYASHKFQPIASKNDATLWSLNLGEANIPFPEWIRLHVTNGSHRSERISCSIKCSQLPLTCFKFRNRALGPALPRTRSRRGTRFTI